MTAGVCLGVVHVPKAGGSAVRSALARLPDCSTGPAYYDLQHFGPAAVAAAVPEPNGRAIADPAALAAIVAGHRVVMGHYAAWSLLLAGCDGLAVQVREPRARILSLYRFWQGQSPAERAGWGRWGSELVARAELPLASFVGSPEVWPAVDNAVLRQLLARGGADGPRRGVPRASGRAWRRRYAALSQQLRVVEWSDCSERFVARIWEHQGAAGPPALGRENVTEPVDDGQVLDAPTLDCLARATRGDRRLLEALMADGLLPRRSPAELDRQLASTAERLGFRLAAGGGDRR